MTSDAVQRQIDRLKKYTTKPIDFTVKTKYYSQRDNYTMPHRTCNGSANAIYLDWLRRVTGRSGLKSDDQYLKRVLSHGDTIYHGNQTKAIKDFGYSTKWMTDKDVPFIKELLETGFPVVCNILHRGSIQNPSGGHIICLIGIKLKEYIAHDPYGTLSSNYTNTDGAYSKINKFEFVKRWQGGYRILA